MKPFTVVAHYKPGPFFERTLLSLTESSLVEKVLVISQEPVRLEMDRCRVFAAGPLPSPETLRQVLSGIQTKYLLLLLRSQPISMEPGALERILEVAESTKAGLVYPDFYEQGEPGKTRHPLNDYQLGSGRDDFDFGPLMLFPVPAIRRALERYGPIGGVRYAGLYDLRLKVSIDHGVHHLAEPLCTVMREDESSRSGGAIHGVPQPEKIFAYVDPRNESVQREMEGVFADHLKRIGAYLPSHHLRGVEQTAASFPVEASVVIPVRNRKETIAGAVKSALSQEADFPFNVLVVDNHSTDGTTAILADLARQHSALKHIIPVRTDLGIGGCWNEALGDPACGRFALQLDSDDLYSSGRSVQKMVDHLRQGHYAMVIGAYALVDSSLKEIPPGLIDHREWTDENGHNNALRINGLGAPRAFHTGLMRQIGFLNVSYGEDYAAALRICREYRIGRIYESLYLCRRWTGNTDAALSVEEANRNNDFKDHIRTTEILARKKIAEGIAQRA